MRLRVGKINVKTTTMVQAVAEAAEWMRTNSLDDDWSDNVTELAIEISDAFDVDVEAAEQMIEERI